MQKKEEEERVLHAGLRSQKISSAICDTICEFFYLMANTVLYKYGSTRLDEYENRQYGPHLTAKVCTDPKTVSYIQKSTKLARNHIKLNQLECFEVSIVDSTDDSLISFRVNIRRLEKFYDRFTKLKEPSLDILHKELHSILFTLQMFSVDSCLRTKINETPSRLRIRLLFASPNPKVEIATPKHCLQTIPPPLKHRLIPFGDNIINEFNQISFSAYLPE